MARRNIILDEKEEAILTHIFQETKANRNFWLLHHFSGKWHGGWP
jgi:hypothetical protein